MRYLLILLLVFSISEAGGFSRAFFKKAVKNIPFSKVAKVSREVSSSKHLTSVVKKLSLKTTKPINRLVNVAENIAKKSPINNKILGTTHPVQALSLYTKGGDKIFKKIDVLSSKASKIDFSMVSKIQKKLPKLPKLSKMTQQQIIDKTMLVTKATGKFGVKVVKGLGEFAIKHPKSAITGILYGWFVADPAGFKAQLDKFGGSIAEFLKSMGTFVGDTLVETGSRLINGIINSVKQNLTPQAFYTLILLFITFIGYKFRGFFMFFFKKRDSKEVEVSNELRKSKRKKGRF